MLQTFDCDICGASIKADPDVEAVTDRAVLKVTKGSIHQVEIKCNEPCPGILYRAIDESGLTFPRYVDGTRNVIPADPSKRHVVIPAPPGGATREVVANDRGEPRVKVVTPTVEPAVEPA